MLTLGVFMVVLYIVLAAIVALFIWLLTQKGDYIVERSMLMQASKKAILDNITDLHAWSDWNPWQLHDRDAKIRYSEGTTRENSWYTWESPYIGSGRMETKAINTDTGRVEQELQFVKPMRTSSTVRWKIDEKSSKECSVTWSMEGHMPFFLRFMTKKMDKMIGMDYEFGLHLLHMQVNSKAERFSIEYTGTEEKAGCPYVYQPYSGNTEGMKQAMATSYPKLIQQIKERKLEANGPPFTVYTAFNAQKETASCHIAIPVKSTDGAAGLQTAVLPAALAYKVQLKGRYEHLEQAWYQSMAHIRMYKLKPGGHPYEVYENDPGETKPENLVTSIYFPLR